MSMGLYIISIALLGLAGGVAVFAVGWVVYEVYKLIKMDLSIKDLSDFDD